MCVNVQFHYACLQWLTISMSQLAALVTISMSQLAPLVARHLIIQLFFTLTFSRQMEYDDNDDDDVGLNSTSGCLFVQFIAAMTGPCGGWNDIPRRLKRHFAVVHCMAPDAQLLNQIFTTTAASFFSDERGFTAEVQQLIVKLVPLTRRIWYTTKVVR